MPVPGSCGGPSLDSHRLGRTTDLKLKERLDLFPHPEDASEAKKERKRDRRDLLAALRTAGLAGADVDAEALFRAAHAFLARTRSVLALVQLDDITDESSPVNVPTTSNEHPNWRRRLALTLEKLTDCARFNDIAEIFQKERPPKY